MREREKYLEETTSADFKIDQSNAKWKKNNFG